MSEIRDFRKIADEVMSDINVSEAMKNEVLSKGRARGRQPVIPLLRLAAAAACGVLVFGILHFTGAFKPSENNIARDDQPNIFSATANLPESAQQPNDSMLKEPSPQQWQPGSLEEAGISFGEGFVSPTFIPEGFELVDIYASGTDTGKADSIILNYFAEERSFVIMEQRSTEAGKFPDFEAIDINGTTGYVKMLEQQTEVYWFKEGVLYSVSGMLGQEDAIKTARSMVPAGSGRSY